MPLITFFSSTVDLKLVLAPVTLYTSRLLASYLYVPVWLHNVVFGVYSYRMKLKQEYFTVFYLLCR